MGPDSSVLSEDTVFRVRRNESGNRKERERSGCGLGDVNNRG